MEQIRRIGDELYFGTERCLDINDAYSRFRAAYHKLLGRDSSRKLDRLGQRAERVHGYGFHFERHPGMLDGGWLKRVPCYLLGLVHVCYCRGVGIWDLPDMDEQTVEAWFDWAFESGNKTLRMSGKRFKSGRTSKRLRTRYR